MSSVEFTRWLEQSGSRLYKGTVERRLALEQQKARTIINNEKSWKWRLQDRKTWLNVALTLTGMRWFGERNQLNIQVKHHTLPIAKLPAAFNGFTVLQISDLHFNGNDALLARLLSMINQLDYGICVLTGDYRFRSFGPIDVSMNSLKSLVETINSDVIAILGNHDSVTMVPEMELLGIKVLLNERFELNKAGSQLLFVGVDDPSFYKTHDIAAALAGCESLEEKASVLLAHSPELYTEAEQAGFGAYLCGHTHGGQICTLFGKPLYRNYRSPNWTGAGQWQHGELNGYTSVGVGTSIVNVRFNCPPEITLHTLTCAS